MNTKAQRIISMHAHIRAMRAHMVRVSAYTPVNSPIMRTLLALQEMRIAKLEALLSI